MADASASHSPRRTASTSSSAIHLKGARRVVLARLEPRLHRDGLRGADEPRVVEEVQLLELRQRNDRFRELRELVAEEVERLQARQVTDRVR